MTLDFGTSYLALFVAILLWSWALVHLFTQRYTPAGTSAWLLVILLLPYVGVPLYAVFGGRKLRKVMRRKAHLRLASDTVLDISSAHDVDRMLRGLTVPGATCGNAFRICADADAAYKAVCDLIASATKTLEVQTYVIKNDATGEDVIKRLSEKAKAGVQVRLLYDSLGSFATRRALFDPLVAAGGRVVEFLPTGWWPFRARSNLRNHRKVIIADGKRAWAGGLNIGHEYMGPKPDPQRWIDLSFELAGPAVQVLTEIFQSDWCFACEEEPGEPSPPVSAEVAASDVLQIIPSGPDVDFDPLYAALVTCAFQAKQRLWICTPYFVPNEPLTEALSLAALRGVDLRIILPRRSNHWPCDLAREPYLRDIQKAGGRILLHPRMLHAKLVLMDDDLAIFGSANIDARSLFLNFEVATACYSGNAIQMAESWLNNIMPALEPRPVRSSLLARLSEGPLRLVAPLL